jgi:hypothetical protein
MVETPPSFFTSNCSATLEISVSVLDIECSLNKIFLISFLKSRPVGLAGQPLREALIHLSLS